MKSKGKEPARPEPGPRPVDGITGSENDFNAKNLEEWERRVFRAASLQDGGHFTVWRKRHEVQTFLNFPEAALQAGGDPTALVYAVTSTGRSFCVVRKQWQSYLDYFKQLHNITE
jgi:hypothetical protein